MNPPFCLSAIWLKSLPGPGNQPSITAFLLPMGANQTEALAG